MNAFADTPVIAHEALIQFLYQAPIGLVQIDDSGDIQLMNPMAAQLLLPLAPRGQLLNLFDALADRAPQLRAQAGATAPGAAVCEALQVVVRQGARANGRDGKECVLSIRLVRLDGRSLMASVSDVTLSVQREQQQLSMHLRDASRTDPLTQLPNRLAIVEHIARALLRAGREPGRHFAVLLINGDRYNRVNVAHGQAVGDELLRMTAARLNGTVREHDAVGLGSAPTTHEQTAARLGNDEFVVVLEGLRRPEDACGIAQRLADALARPYLINEVPLHVSCTLGLVIHDPQLRDGSGPAGVVVDGAADFAANLAANLAAAIVTPADAEADIAAAAAAADSMLQDANLAMLQARRAGGARWCRFDPAMKVRAQRRGSIETDLREALLKRELFVVYQPIVRLGSSGVERRVRVAGFEALVRWQHPQRGLLPPFEFIEIAEESGLICELGAYVLEAACLQFASWREQLGAAAPETLSVNLSRAQLLDASIAQRVRQALDKSGLRASCLQLELTESLAAQDDVVRQRLVELKALGLTLALDDFGTGYSSLSSLHLLPIDVVKIDRSFVSQAEGSAHHRVLIEATVRVAQSLGMRTVAEGIETSGQAAILGELHCDKGQGYLIAKPMTAEVATQWLQTGV